MVKNCPQYRRPGFEGREDPLKKGMATHSVILPGIFHGQRNLVGYSLWGCKQSDTTEQMTLLLLFFRVSFLYKETQRMWDLIFANPNKFLLGLESLIGTICTDEGQTQ